MIVQFCIMELKQAFLKIFFLFGISLFCTNTASSQNSGFAFRGWEGFVLTGYVDHGAFLNFTGPNLQYTYKNSKFLLGMLPSLRWKKDHSVVTKNAAITPNLGVGLTYSISKWAIQIPFYYNTKTTTKNGEWFIGFGVGIRIKTNNQQTSSK